MNKIQIEEQYGDHYIFRMKGYGASDELKGRIRINLVFLGSAENDWDLSDKANFKKKFEPTMDHLMNEAKKS